MGVTAVLHRLKLSFARSLRRLARSEDGGMIILGLFLLLLMLLVGGMSVDIMHHEATRARVQGALDRAVLAAASLDQTADEDETKAIVRDYFAKAGVAGSLGNLEADVAINSRSVTVNASAELGTFFMRLAGVDNLTVPASSAAIESRSDIEIVLVLDVSGSMGNNSKIVNLRTAAREFVQTVLANDRENRVSIAIVPFNAQVNLGPTLFNAMVDGGYDIVNRHGVAGSFCIDLPSAAFDNPSVTTSLTMPQAGFFDGESSTQKNHTTYVDPISQDQDVELNRVFCRTEPQNVVRLPSQDIGAMQNQISALTANGNTSITMGMKWGLALLDPNSRPLFDDLIEAGHMPATLSGRPFDYDRPNTRKIMVVMTDGEHVSSLFLEPGYRTETSPIFRSGAGNYSLHMDRPSTNADYWSPAFDPDRDASNGIQGGWRVTPYDGTFDEDADGDGPDTDADGGTGATQLAWHEVWQSVRVSWVAWQLYARASCPPGNSSGGNKCRNDAYKDWMNNFTGSTNVNTMNSTLQQSCQQARDRRVEIYGIAFEAPENGQRQIFGCASPSHYFNAQGLEIQTVFRSIAAQINSLRLVQ